MTLGTMNKRNKIVSNNNNVNRKVPNEAMEDGIYRNARAAHVAASIIGCPVQVRVKNGTIYDGILATISPEMTIVLEMAHKSNENGSSLCLPLAKDMAIIDTIVINWPDVVSMTALNVDLGYASKESFATDSAISSRSNGQSDELRVLQPFECDGPAVGGLDDEQNGWSPDDMFQTNESKFTVHSSFNQDLSQYTTPLPNANSADYREKNERAERLAMEIEGGNSYRNRAQLENGGEDEEMAFSAVHRNQRPRNNHQNNSNALQWRRGAGANVNGGSRGGGRGGTNVSSTGRGGGPSGLAPAPRQMLPPGQQGSQASLSPRSAAGTSQPPFPSAYQSQISPKSGGFERSPEGRFHSQQPERNFSPDTRPSTEFNRQSSTGSDGRNHVPSLSNNRPVGNHNEVKVTGPSPSSADVRSSQPGAARDSRKSGGVPSPVDKVSSGADKTKSAPWGANQQQPSLPSRSEPPSLRSQMAPPPSSAPPAQQPEHKSQQRDEEAKKAEGLQESSKSPYVQVDSSQGKDAKISSRQSVQPSSGPHPSPQKAETGSLDGQTQTPKTAPTEQATVVKQPSDESSLALKSKETDKVQTGEDVGDATDKKSLMAKTSKLNPNAREFTLNPSAKEFSPAKVSQPAKPVPSPTPPRAAPNIAPPVAAPAAAQILVPTGYYPMQPYPGTTMMLPGITAAQMRPMQANNKRATVSASGRIDQAQAATGQPLIAPQQAPYNFISIVPQPSMQQVIPARLLDPGQMSAQQQSGQQPIPVTTMIVNQPGVPMTQPHMVGGQSQVAANPAMNPPPPPPPGAVAGQGGSAHPSSSPVHQQQQTGPLQPSQTPTSGTPQPTQLPPQIFYSQQQPGHGPPQMMAAVQGTPPSPQQQHAVFQPQHFTAALQQQLGHSNTATAYQFAPGAPQQFQPMPLHMSGTPGAGAPHGVVQVAGLPHPHMPPAHVIMQHQQPGHGQLHPAQMQPMMGQGALAHSAIPGGLPTQPAQLANIGPQGFVAAQPMGNVYYHPMPYIQPGTFHPAGHAIPSSVQFQQTQ